MALTNSDLTDLLGAIRAGGDIDVIRKGVELVLHALIEAEATDRIGAARCARSVLSSVLGVSCPGSEHQEG